MTNRFAQIARFIAARKRKLGVAAIAIIALEVLAAAAIALFAHARIEDRGESRDSHGASVRIMATEHSFGASLTVF